jgi:hypothetical protein
MSLTVKEITLWPREVENRTGTMASTLAPLAEAGADLRVVMGYRYPSVPVAGKDPKPRRASSRDRQCHAGLIR